MFFGVSHVEVPVKRIDAALVLYRDVLGFAEKHRGEGYVDLDAGAVLVRLVEAGDRPSPARIRVQVARLADALEAVNAAGASTLYAPMRTPEQEEFAVARDRDGNVLILHRMLSEDELDFVPELPTERAWDPAAEALMKGLLSHVPALFRALARRKVTRLAEELAEETGGKVVGREHVVRGFILSSARVTRHRNRAPLLAHGIDPDAYRADFEA